MIGRSISTAPRRRTRRRHALPLAVTAIALTALVTACSSSGSGGAGSTGTNASGGSGGCSKHYTFRLGDANPEAAASPMTQLAKYFGDQINADSGGCITLRYFPNSQLGVSTSLLTGVLTGSIDFAQVTTGTVAARDPKFYIYTYPFLATTHEQLYKLFNSDASQTVLQGLKSQGATGLFVDDNGPFIFTFSKKVSDPAGFHGTKIRAYPDPLNTSIVQKLGAQAVPLDFPQVYSSLQSGVITGVEASPSAFIASKLQEVAKHAILVVPDWTSQALFVSNKTLNSLPANLQAAVMKAAAAAKTKADELTATALSGAKDALTTAGFDVVVPDSLDAFQQATASVTAEYDSKIGADLVAKIKAAVAG